MEHVKLIDVTAANWEQVCCLNPGKEGREFVASNSFSIAQSVFESGWVIKAIQKGNALIGFAMYGFCEELDGYELCRFMLDWRYQGNGYGKAALQQILQEMFHRYGCDKIYLSTSPNNSKGRHVYESAGFVKTGATCGEDDDLEEIYCLQRN